MLDIREVVTLVMARMSCADLLPWRTAEAWLCTADIIWSTRFAPRTSPSVNVAGFGSIDTLSGSGPMLLCSSGGASILLALGRRSGGVGKTCSDARQRCLAANGMWLLRAQLGIVLAVGLARHDTSINLSNGVPI